MKILAFLVCSMILAGCEQKQGVIAQIKKPDRFDRRVRCFELSQRAEKDRQDNKGTFAFNRIIYSPKLQTCIARSTYLTHDIYLSEVENLLSVEVLDSFTCSTKDKNCNLVGVHVDKMEKMMDDLELEAK